MIKYLLPIAMLISAPVYAADLANITITLNPAVEGAEIKMTRSVALDRYPNEYKFSKSTTGKNTGKYTPTAPVDLATDCTRAFDRGSADSYYHRPANPHYFAGDTYASNPIVAEPGTPEYEAYMAGYEYNEAHGDKKDWG